MSNTQPTAKDFRFNFSEFKFSEQDGKRRFSGVAYSGLAIENHDFWGKVIFDLSSTAVPGSLPILLEHDRSKRIGFSNEINVSNSIAIAGEMLSNGLAKSVANDADDGFPWQMSVHISPDRVEEVPIDKPVTVNGQQFSGGYVFRNNKIREVSFTPTGWDDKTSATIFNHNGDQAVSDPKDKEAIASLTQENAELKASNQALTQKVGELESSIQSMQASQRTEQIKTLFSDLGRKYSENEAKPYLAMDDETFSAIAKDMRASKPAPGQQFFENQATGGEGNNQFSLADLMKQQAGVN